VRRALLPFVLAAPLAAQTPVDAGFGTTVRSGPIYEGYSIGAGLAFDRISELTVPIAVSQRLGSRLIVDLATAYADASVHAANGSTYRLAGLVDTDIRAALALVPGRLIFTVVGTLPTGQQTVPDSTLPLFGALATDVLDFTTPSFGSGGGVTAGFATATKWGGSWAVGLGASYRYAASFTPIAGGGDLKPGNEGRARLGIEGPLGGGKYLRVAVVYTASQHNEYSGGGPAAASDTSVTGDRALVYGSLSAPLGRASLSVYGFEMARLRPRAFNTTYANAIQMPRGNVLALGVRLDRPLSPRATLSPCLEFRHELTDEGAGLALLGYLVRPGVNLRYRLSGAAAVVLQGQLAFGAVENQGSSSSLVGRRLGVVLEWMR